MDKPGFWSLLVLCVIYLWLADNKVAGKCSGRWAIHACRGGNGKRSDPSSYDPGEEENMPRKQLKLHDLLNLPTNSRNTFSRDEVLAQEYPPEEVVQEDGEEEQPASWVYHHDRLHRARTLWQKLVKLLGTKSIQGAQ